MSAETDPADAPGRQLARVRRGQAVASINLPQGDTILVDARPGGDDEILVARLGPGGGFCWCRYQRPGAEKRWLKQGNGDITTAGSRENCDGWPSKFRRLSVGGSS